MPRKSAASLATVTPLPVQRRPEPLPELMVDEAQVWRDTVGAMPWDWFAQAPELLAQYCRHVIRARVIAAMIHETDPRADLATYQQLSTMAAAETRAISMLATRLRLTQQSRYQPDMAHRRAADPNARREPWSPII
jgi:hypothetical protein